MLIVKCFEHIFAPSPNELAGGVCVGAGGGVGSHSRTMHYAFTHCIWLVLTYVYTLR